MDSDYESELIEMRENVLPILERHGVDLVLAGHSHGYVRSVLLQGHYGSSATLSPEMILDDGRGRSDRGAPYVERAGGHGSVYVVAGSSGQATYGSMDHPVIVVSFLRLGSLVLDIDGHVLQAEFLSETGKVDDSFTIDKRVTGPERAANHLFSIAAPGPDVDLELGSGQAVPSAAGDQSPGSGLA